MLPAVLGAVLIGLALGLLGSGGSILTVPMLVHGLGQPEKLAIAGSLVIVGSISLAGSVVSALRRAVDWTAVPWFGVPGIAGSIAGARWSSGIPGSVQMLMFAAVMLTAGVFMLHEREREPRRAARWKLALCGVCVGALTGLVGVGGGFMIVPALVLLGGVALHDAIGTSLVLIAVTAWTGFWQHASVLERHGLTLDTPVLGLFVALGTVGALGGQALGARLPQRTLRRIFALALLAGAAVLVWTSW